MSFKLQQKQTDPPGGRQVSSLRGGRCSGGPRGGGRGHGRGGGDRSSGVFSEEELAACKVVNRHYSKEEYNKLTPLHKQKLFTLRNPGRKLGTGPTRQSRGSGNATVPRSHRPTQARNALMRTPRVIPREVMTRIRPPGDGTVISLRLLGVSAPSRKLTRWMSDPHPIGPDDSI